MPGLVDSASAVMHHAQRRLEVAALNISNSATPGYKIVTAAGDFAEVTAQLRARMDQGKLAATGRPLDLAISGEGLFQVRDGDRLLYTRQGEFTLNADGLVVSPQGYILQQAGGGDLALDHGAVAIASDGLITDDGRPVGRVGLFKAADGTTPLCLDGALFSLRDARPADAPQIRQGMLEASSVEVGGQMITTMLALREADAGAKLFQAYDDLLGRAITTFGEAGR